MHLEATKSKSRRRPQQSASGQTNPSPHREDRLGIHSSMTARSRLRLLNKSRGDAKQEHQAATVWPRPHPANWWATELEACGRPSVTKAKAAPLECMKQYPRSGQTSCKEQAARNGVRPKPSEQSGNALNGRWKKRGRQRSLYRSALGQHEASSQSRVAIRQGTAAATKTRSLRFETGIPDALIQSFAALGSLPHSQLPRAVLAGRTALAESSSMGRARTYRRRQTRSSGRWVCSQWLDRSSVFRLRAAH